MCELEQQIMMIFEYTSIRFGTSIDQAVSLLDESLIKKGDAQDEWKDSKEEFSKCVCFLQKLLL